MTFLIDSGGRALQHFAHTDCVILNYDRSSDPISFPVNSTVCMAKSKFIDIQFCKNLIADREISRSWNDLLFNPHIFQKIINLF